MKIAYLFERYPSTTETFLAREVEALRRAGAQIEVFAIEAGSGATSIDLPSRSLKLLGKSLFWKRAGASLVGQLRSAGLQHVHATWANHIAGLAGATADAAGVSWSFAAHARDLWVDGGDLKAKLASARFGTTCTRAGEEHLKQWGSNVLYAPHGLELDKYPWREWRSGGEEQPFLEIVGVGRLIEKKGWLDAVDAVAMLNEGGVRSRLSLVGDGPLRSQLENAAKLHGSLPHAEAIEVMRSSHCLLLPSRRTRDGDRDGLANVLLEAAALGLPIVTTSAGSASDFVDDTTGILVEPENPAALRDALLQTFSEPKKTAERCRNARVRVEADFNVEKNVIPLLKAFNAAISQGNRTSL